MEDEMLQEVVPGGLEVIESADGATLYVSRGAGGLWSQSLRGDTEERQVIPDQVMPGYWELTEDGVDFLDVTVPDHAATPVRSLDFSTERLATIGEMPRNWPSGNGRLFIRPAIVALGED